MKKIIACFTDFYVPAYKAGGAIRSVRNLVNCLSDEYEFYIFTRDRDSGDDASFAEVVTNQWTIRDKVNIYYASPCETTASGILKAFNGIDIDVIYLNSFFSYKFTIIPLLLRYINLLSCKKCIIAPRGEFSPGAINIKRNKKFLYIILAKILFFFRTCYWQASSKIEQDDIKNIINPMGYKIVIAPDLISSPPMDSKITAGYNTIVADDVLTTRQPNILKIIFISRISRKKNIDYLLTMLRDLSFNLSLTIYGPIEDKDYWEYCINITKVFPLNISFKYGGILTPEEIPIAFSEHDVFLFPTLGENFGHVIYESLASGTPVVISDQTPWENDSNGGVTVLSLDAQTEWLRAISNLYNEPRLLRIKRREAALSAALLHYKRTNSRYIDQNRQMFST